MCGQMQQRSQGQFFSTPAMEQMELRRKPLTQQEQRQRQSESQAWEHSGLGKTNPYERLPQSRLAIVRNRRYMPRGFYGRP
jgi:hypothetical protein